VHPPPSLVVPALPPELLRQHRCAVPQDTRYRAAARLAQSLWRDRQRHPCGRVRDPTTGHRRLLGSRLTPAVARTGANLADPALLPLVRHELAYREVGAAIEPERLWGNLLASQALVFGLFGPLKLDTALATAALRPLFPDLVGTVTDILFEHSPGRGDPAFTGDRTAFDVLVRCTTPAGRRAFLAVEVKYTEAPGGTQAPPNGRHDALSRAAGVFADPDSRALRGGALQQFWRQQLLATAMLERGLYDEGHVVVVAPAPNRELWNAVRLYTAQLADPEPARARFEALTLERIVTCIAEAGAEPAANCLAERYLDFRVAREALAASIRTAPPR
jgi:hypothetical protein